MDVMGTRDTSDGGSTRPPTIPLTQCSPLGHFIASRTAYWHFFCPISVPVQCWGWTHCFSPQLHTHLTHHTNIRQLPGREPIPSSSQSSLLYPQRHRSGSDRTKQNLIRPVHKTEGERKAPTAFLNNTKSCKYLVGLLVLTAWDQPDYSGIHFYFWVLFFFSHLTAAH